MLRSISRGIVAVAGLVALACGPDEGTPDVAADGPRARSATARLAPTEGHAPIGTVRFAPADDGVLIQAEVEGLPPGAHAFHVHENGDCSAPDATSAGPHFAFEPTPGTPDRVTGNLGELVADQNGRATRDAWIRRASLTGSRSIVGRAVVVHARGNDPSRPPGGAAGERIACGVILEDK